MERASDSVVHDPAGDLFWRMLALRRLVVGRPLRLGEAAVGLDAEGAKRCAETEVVDAVIEASQSSAIFLMPWRVAESRKNAWSC
jgi:hypothetical protein